MLLIDIEEIQLHKLQKAQNRAVKIISQCDRHTKMDDMLQVLQFMFIRGCIIICVYLFLKS